MPKPIAFSVDLSSPVAVYAQIENQIRFAIASGDLAPGDPVPSVRDLSAAVDVNPNTVTKAYRDLELLGLVRARRGVGVSVTEDAPKICAKVAVAQVRGSLKNAVAECLACGLPGAGIRRIVSAAIKKGERPYAS